MNSRNLDLKNIFHHELAPVPTSMFDDDGQMRITTTTLKNKLKIDQSARALPSHDAIIIDGCAILWIIYW